MPHDGMFQIDPFIEVVYSDGSSMLCGHGFVAIVFSRVSGPRWVTLLCLTRSCPLSERIHILLVQRTNTYT